MGRLKMLREGNKMRQKDLADILKVNQRTISNWEKGISEPSIDLLYKISIVFDVEISYLFGKDNKTKKAKRINK